MIKQFLIPILLVGLCLFSNVLQAECSDAEAIEATEDAALKLFNGSKIFLKGKVLKLHLPSERKETAAYLKNGDKYYTFFGMVNTDCSAVIMKRTHGKY